MAQISDYEKEEEFEIENNFEKENFTTENIELNTSVNSRNLSSIHPKNISVGEIPASYLNSMTYYEQLEWLCKYLEDTVIPTLNNNATGLEEVQTLYNSVKDFINTHENNMKDFINNSNSDIENYINNNFNNIQNYINDNFDDIQDYINNYYHNLNVQNEINNKLNDMQDDGSLQAIIKKYADPSGSPKGAYSSVSALTTANPDTGVYVITENGHIYSYTKNSNNAIDLGVYQATEIGEESIQYQMLSLLLKNFFNKTLSYKNYNSPYKRQYGQEDITWESGWQGANGNINEPTNEQYVHSNFININEGDIIRCRFWNRDLIRGCIVYDVDNNVIANPIMSTDGIYIAPKNSAKLRLSCNVNDKNSFYAYKLSLVTDNIFIKDKSINPAQINDIIMNSFTPVFSNDTYTVHNNQYFNRYDRNIQNINGINYVEIDVQENEIYLMENGNYFMSRQYVLFDENDNVIYTGDDNKNSNEETKTKQYITIPANVVKMIVNLYPTSSTIKKVIGFKQANNEYTNKTIVCGGDSLTQGYQTGEHGNYVNFMRPFYPNVNIINNGSSGGTSARLVNMLTNFGRDNTTTFPPRNPDYTKAIACIINIGANDGTINGSTTTSIPQVANATDLEDNPLNNLTINQVLDGGIKYNGVEITTEEEYWNLFARNWYGNVGLCIEYIQWKNPKCQIFLLPPCISSNYPIGTNNNSSESISNHMKILAQYYGINFIDINNAIGINRRNDHLYRVDYIHGNDLRDEMVGKYVAKYISNKIYE